MFFRKNQVKVKVYHVSNDCFSAWATDGKLNVYNCFGNSKEAAKEMALFKLSKIQEERASDTNQSLYH
jgi:hypothetical protein